MDDLIERLERDKQLLFVLGLNLMAVDINEAIQRLTKDGEQSAVD